MEFQRMAACAAQNKKNSISGKPSQQLSDGAFYLIALSVLLKEQTGEPSLNHYLAPGVKPGPEDAKLSAFSVHRCSTSPV